MVPDFRSAVYLLPVVAEQMDEGHLVGLEVVAHVLDVDDYGYAHDHDYGYVHGGVGCSVVRRPLVLPDPKI